MTAEPIGGGPTLGQVLQEQVGRMREKATILSDQVTGASVSVGTDAALADARRRALAGQWDAIAPAKYRDARLDDFGDGPPRDALNRWRGNWGDGINLLVFGPTGVGKTHAAFAAARHPFAETGQLDFWPVVELLDLLDWRNPEAGDHMHTATHSPLVILDDLGLGDSNEWRDRMLYSIINRRWLDDLPTIATTNLPPEQLRQNIGERTFSRLADHAIVVRLAGDDRRAG